jgi:hypothetical protein
VSLPFGLCSDDEPEVDPDDAFRAVQAVLPRHEGDPNNVPPIGNAHSCTLTPGRGLDNVQGNCLWTVESQGEQFIVTLRQTWRCEDFSGDFANYPPCSGQTGFHEWEYLVDLDRGSVQLLEERGQFPPDYVE